jgi:hypothetical protein
VLELGQLDLQLAFVRPRALREDVEDQPRAVDDAALGEFLEIALLDRAQGVVDQDQVGIERLLLRLQLVGLAGADEITRIRPLDASAQRTNDTGAGRTRQLAEFLQRERIVLARRLRLQQQRALAFSRSFEQRKSPSSESVWMRPGTADSSAAPDRAASPRSGPFVGRRVNRRRGVRHMVVGTADAHVARRHDRRDRMLVDHLADRIAQQHDELVERFHRSLQLDAIDQIDRNRHALTPQRVQKRILQRLPLGHGLVLLATKFPNRQKTARRT